MKRLLPLSLLFLGVFFYLPIFLIVKEGIDVKALVDVLTDSYHLRVISFTFVQAIGSTVVTLVIGLPGAYIFAKYDFPGRDFLKALITIPFVMPSVMVALGFLILFGKSGPFGWLNILYSWKAIILAHAFYNYPVVVRMVSAVLERTNPHYEEAAMTLGARGFLLFRKVTFPLILPGVISSALLTFTFSFMSFSIPLILGGYKYSTLEVDIFASIMVLLDFKTGSALALLQLILSLVFIYAYLKILTFYAKMEEQRIMIEKKKLKGLTLYLTLLYFAFIGVFIIGPLMAVVVDSLTYDGRISLEWYMRAFSEEYNPMFGTTSIRTILNSLIFGVFTMVISLLVALPLAYTITKYRFKGKILIDALATLPLASSSVVLGLGYLLAFRKTPLYDSWVIIVLAHSTIAYPFVLRALSSSLVKIKKSLFEAALTLGAKEGIAFKEVELPLIQKGLITGALFAFAISLGELATTYMLARPEYTTLTMAIYKFISARQFGPASALAVILMFVSGISFLIIEKVGGEIW
ncbi:MAG: thiamine transport system permease protein [Pyrococcus sp.]|uniref:ABC transporter permease n=1 Tax=Pyrococcus sp. TaxID=33866 RepID=UPI0025880DAB|nr:iron ABC transporter permease [Pyrococcus sp.]MDK2869035.1 thiamine transport system permease protein [Pyrococcus sp.]